jgi:hypothetical protein
MSEQATQQAKQPEVQIKTVKAKAEPKPKPTMTETAKKRLQELSAEITRIEALKKDRLNLMRKERSKGIAIPEIAEAAGLSVPRARQVLGPNGK